ncbi:hypothetical protein PO587_42175 [Streptomyces gilvifuscus]|uniref:Phosphatidate cytidylyltransferase n=1 Tax=Streptomyces gilvifuscus TaxID=1550617 RepID=A0ABT5G910_9ACTN|nr:hypothetical protein [Streptomyces gilvifuscus]MDC2961052.1 hypothetical protein [Streptomyces gilvifuscus]
MREPERAPGKVRRIAGKAGKVALAAALGALVRWAVTWLLGRLD